ncbi:M20/M25/M40 family metallo-hydrolase [Bacillus songklensis]|uniref:M20/M25/M40 family metallo-hydrolase n=1 Tax=Bacillus songklensis TaxID=1069116 RepID=A0ABV8B813_9BACI
MKTWNQLFVRHGWELEKKEESVFVCKTETVENMDFLLESLDKAGASYSYGDDMLMLHSVPVPEKKWIEVVDFKHRGRGEGLWFRPGEEEPKLRELDTYISGIVRQLNRLGFYTMGSCDGHERRDAHVSIKKGKDIEQLVQMLLALGMRRVYCREGSESYHVSFPLKRNELLDIAEKMSLVEESWLEKGHDYIKERMFYHLLEQLLSIPGESGKEGKVREFVKEKLTPFVDCITVDRNGNLLAEKTYRAGHGPTILLNAHLDTVQELESNRVIKKEGAVWSSSNGILGADDRAGVAVLLHIAEHLMHSSSFSGKVKFIFTVEEECGLIGARHVDDYFLWGTDAAIVVDRRGAGDIVVSCGGYIPFCHEAYGKFIEDTAKAEGLSGWHCTNGGSSDTRIWASHGIQSVNLSAGYGNEHTENEFLDVEACYNVTKLIKGVFGRARELRSVLQEIERKKVVRLIIRKAQ